MIKVILLTIISATASAATKRHCNNKAGDWCINKKLIDAHATTIEERLRKFCEINKKCEPPSKSGTQFCFEPQICDIFDEKYEK